MTRSKISIFASPLLCLGLLAGIVAEDRTHLKPSDVEPYHARARQVIEAWPKTIAEGSWSVALEQPLPESAEKLLHPNCKVSRGYISASHRLLDGQYAQASLLVVQCKDSRDMTGHYPPNCYPAAGYPEIGKSTLFSMNIAGMEVTGKEYTFLKSALPVTRQCVYDFFVVPGEGTKPDDGIKPDMAGVLQAAKDYQKRYYGAAQFQVVMDADYPHELRETIFREIIGANAKALSVLKTVEVK